MLHDVMHLPSHESAAAPVSVNSLNVSSAVRPMGFSTAGGFLLVCLSSLSNSANGSIDNAEADARIQSDNRNGV